MADIGKDGQRLLEEATPKPQPTNYLLSQQLRDSLLTIFSTSGHTLVVDELIRLPQVEDFFIREEEDA